VTAIDVGTATVTVALAVPFFPLPGSRDDVTETVSPSQDRAELR